MMELEQKLNHFKSISISIFKSSDHARMTVLCNSPRNNSPPPMCSSQGSKYTCNITNSQLYIKIFYLQDMFLNKTLLVINFLKQTDLLCHQEASD